MTATETELEPHISDFYDYQNLLSDADKEVVAGVREFARTQLAPIADDYWARAEFPHHLIPELAKLDVAGMAWERPGHRKLTRLASSFASLELSRVDSSFSTFFGVHTGLSIGSIAYCGSEEQKQRWLPDMFALNKIGAFALSEPHGGSDVAGGLETTARRDGDMWILDGAKRWIGNGTFADLIVVWARDVADNEVKGFVVEKDTPGFSASKIEGKLALRSVENADITLHECRVPEENRLAHANSFKDTGRVLRLTRGGVAWGAVGCMMGAYEEALRYTQQRVQFDKPIAKFQLVQEHLAEMIGNITASLGMAVRVAQLQDEGVFRDQQAALAKSYCTSRLRDTVSRAREVMGGNGILLENRAAKYFNDAEALYSYEGTKEINTLIVGRAVSGYSAFV